jgi:hypothetical protein
VQSQIGFGLVFLDGREWLAPCRVFSPLLLTSFEKKSLLFFFMKLEGTRTEKIMCRRTVPADFSQLTSGKFPLCRVVFSTTAGGK